MRAPASLPAGVALIAIGLACWLGACVPLGRPSDAPKQALDGRRLRLLDLSDVAQPVASAGPALLDAARNEWVSFAVELPMTPRGGRPALRVRAPRTSDGKTAIAPAAFEAYEIVDMPVDLNRAGHVRHTGEAAAAERLPRALLPLAARGGLVPLREGTARVWVDLHVPAGAEPGDYAGAVELVGGRNSRLLGALPVRLTVHDFTLPDEPTLGVAGRAAWDDLVRLYPDRFKDLSPRLLERGDARSGDAVRTLDQLIGLARSHRVGLWVSRLQPTVKWPAAGGTDGPSVDWGDYDRLVGPWLEPGAGGGRASLWPLPEADHLDQYDRRSQLAYWLEAARHFQQKNWLDHSPVWLDASGPGRAPPAEAVELSQLAGQLLRLHERLRVALPLEDDQVQLADRDGPEMILPEHAERVWAAAPGLVFAPPTQLWPEGVARPQYFLRTDLPGLAPYAGGGERDHRLWAWLAFLRHGGLVTLGDALPAETHPSDPADPDRTTWFYPGEWFGLDAPVPTVQLKWLRRAVQDYEYLELAGRRGEVPAAMMMARLITRPVLVQPGQVADPAHALMCGTSDAKSLEQARQLMARTISLREEGRPFDAARQQALYVDTRHWSAPRERPLLLGRSVQWMWDNVGADPAARALSVRLGVDIYNPSDSTPDHNFLKWATSLEAWKVSAEATPVPTLGTYTVRRETLGARVELGKLRSAARQPVEVTFTNGFTGRETGIRLVLPVAASERLAGRTLVPDGRFDEWDDEDLIQDGPLVRMLSRPGVQRQETRPASTPSRVYTGWAEDNFQVAFDVQGITVANLLRGGQNYVDYDARRAWGEDLCAMLIQPVFADNTVGPVLHVVCKPAGHWVERKLDPRHYANPWQPLEGTGIRYKSVIDGTNWRGEVAIPWRAVCDAKHGVPPLVRFNFVQHRAATGESASWAGPVDFGRDETFTGVLYLRDAVAPGIGSDR